MQILQNHLFQILRLLLCAVVFFAAIGSQAQDRNHLKVVFCGEENGEAAQIYLQIIANWERTHPDYTVDPRFLAWENCHDNAMAEIHMLFFPDIAQIDSRALAQLHYFDLLTPIELSEDQKFRYPPLALEGTMIRAQSYALPLFWSPRLLFVNRELLRQAKLEPQFPQNPTELYELCRQVKTNTKAYGFGLLANHSSEAFKQLLQSFYGLGGSFKNDGRFVIYDEEPLARTLALYAELMPCAGREALSDDAETVTRRFLWGEVAFMNGDAELAKRAEEFALDFEARIFPADIGRTPSAMMDADVLVVFKNSPHQEAALTLAHEIARAEALQQLITPVGYSPLARPENFPDYMKPFFEAQSTASFLPQFIDYLRFQENNIHAVHDFLITGNNKERAINKIQSSTRVASRQF